MKTYFELLIIVIKRTYAINYKGDVYNSSKSNLQGL